MEEDEASLSDSLSWLSGTEAMVATPSFQMKMEIKHLRDRLEMLAGGTNAVELAEILEEREEELATLRRELNDNRPSSSLSAVEAERDAAAAYARKERLERKRLEKELQSEALARARDARMGAASAQRKLVLCEERRRAASDSSQDGLREAALIAREAAVRDKEAILEDAFLVPDPDDDDDDDEKRSRPPPIKLCFDEASAQGSEKGHQTERKSEEERDEALDVADQALRERDAALADNSRLQASCEQRLVECDRALSERDKAVAESDRLVRERDRARAEIDELLAELNAAVAERDRALAEKDQENLDRAAADRITLAEQLDKSVAECDDLVRERDAGIAEVNKLLAALDEAVAERDRAQLVEISAAEEKAQALAERDRALRAELDAKSRLREEREKMGASETEFSARLRDDLARAEEKYAESLRVAEETADAQIEVLRDSYEETIETLHIELDSTRAAASADKAKADQQLEALREVYEEDMRHERDAASLKLTAKERELVSLRNEYENAASALRKRLDAGEGRLTAVKVAAEKQQQSAVQKLRDSYEDAIHELRSELDAVASELSSSRRDLVASRAEHDSELDSLRSEYESINDAARADLSSALSELQRARRERDDAAEAATLTERDSASARVEAAKEAERAQFEHLLEESREWHEAEMADAQRSVDESRARLDATCREKNDELRRVAEIASRLEAAHSAAKGRVESLERDLSRAEQRSVELENKLAKTQAELDLSNAATAAALEQNPRDAEERDRLVDVAKEAKRKEAEYRRAADRAELRAQMSQHEIRRLRDELGAARSDLRRLQPQTPVPEVATHEDAVRRAAQARAEAARVLKAADSAVHYYVRKQGGESPGAFSSAHAESLSCSDRLDHEHLVLNTPTRASQSGARVLCELTNVSRRTTTNVLEKKLETNRRRRRSAHQLGGKCDSSQIVSKSAVARKKATVNPDDDDFDHSAAEGNFASKTCIV